MNITYSQLGEPLASELTTALIDLAVLARKAGWTASEHLGSVANDMLKCLLTLCKAERGAVLLREDHDIFERPNPALTTPVNATGFRALALHHMLDEEVHALLTALPTQDAPIQVPDVTCWMTCRLHLGEATPGDARNPLEMLPGASFDLAEQGQHALLVIGWKDEREQDHDCALLLPRCSALLPLVADSAGAVITSILLKERVQELERKSIREALEGMELLKAELLGTVSHELRSPLASIKGYAATLLRNERRLAREERHQFLLAINEASDRLEVIIKRLLEVSQLETGQVTIQRSPIDVAHLVAEAIAAIEEQVTAVQPGRFLFHLQLEGADGAENHASVPLILADFRGLREVLDNLLENAIKYSPEGGLIKVTIRQVVQVSPVAKGEDALRPHEENGLPNTYVPRNMLEICVSDDGQGIPIDHLNRIFDRFHRVDTSLTREVNGLGLGLAICKRIIELHNGVIWAENRPHGKGSAFYMLLPIDEVNVSS